MSKLSNVLFGAVLGVAAAAVVESEMKKKDPDSPTLADKIYEMTFGSQKSGNSIF